MKERGSATRSNVAVHDVHEKFLGFRNDQVAAGHGPALPSCAVRLGNNSTYISASSAKSVVPFWPQRCLISGLYVTLAWRPFGGQLFVMNGGDVLGPFLRPRFLPAHVCGSTLHERSERFVLLRAESAIGQLAFAH